MARNYKHIYIYSNYDSNNNDFEISDNKISDNKISDDKIIVTKNIDFNQRFNNQSQKKIKATNYNTTINFDKLHSKMTKKRGQYQSYQKLILKNEKQLIIKELIKGKQGIIAKIHKKTNIPKSTLCNWKISYDASNIRRG